MRISVYMCIHIFVLIQTRFKFLIIHQMFLRHYKKSEILFKLEVKKLALMLVESKRLLDQKNSSLLFTAVVEAKTLAFVLIV